MTGLHQGDWSKLHNMAIPPMRLLDASNERLHVSAYMCRHYLELTTASHDPTYAYAPPQQL